MAPGALHEKIFAADGAEGLAIGALQARPSLCAGEQPWLSSLGSGSSSNFEAQRAQFPPLIRRVKTPDYDDKLMLG